jgi:NTP pyrophosphatase (non-canonical NTP hydrolase)
LAIALVVEAGEVAEIFQWLTEEESMNLPPEAVASAREELADTFIYLLSLADKLEIDLSSAAQDKLGKNAERYPAETVRGKSLKYTEYDAS